MTAVERHLDIGGLMFPPDEETSLFVVAARQHPEVRYAICDLRTPKPELVVPPNLTIDTPMMRNVFITNYYKLPYPNTHFSTARMDMVLDYLADPILHLQVMRELYRVLTPGGSLGIVDVQANRRQGIIMARLAGFQRPTIVRHNELIASSQPISIQALAFLEAGATLFQMTTQRR